jgi:hypothetical protein
MNMISPAHAICLAAFVLALPAMSSPAWCQTDGSAKTDKVEAKEASKARKEALKEAEKAIKTGDIDQLKAILEANPGLVSAPTPQSVTAGVAATVLFGPVLAYDAQSNVTLLHDAAEGKRNTEGKRKEAVELLLSYHANVNARDGFGYTPLHMAIMSQSTDIVQLLLDNGADVNARAKNGDTPLKLVLWLKRTRTRAQPLQPFLDIEQLLLQHGAHK